MTPEKVKRSLRRLQRRLASNRRRHLAFLLRQTARLKAAWGSNARSAVIESEMRRGVRRRPTRQELRVEAGFHDSIHDLGRV